MLEHGHHQELLQANSLRRCCALLAALPTGVCCGAVGHLERDQGAWETEACHEPEVEEDLFVSAFRKWSPHCDTLNSGPRRHYQRCLRTASSCNHFLFPAANEASSLALRRSFVICDSACKAVATCFERSGATAAVLRPIPEKCSAPSKRGFLGLVV